MALINCPECGGEISELATICPHCGYGMKKVERKKVKKDSGNRLSKITATNVLALIIQIALVVFLFVNMISMTYEEDFLRGKNIGEWQEEEWKPSYDIFIDSYEKSKTFNIANLSFKNLNKYFENLADNHMDTREFNLIKGGFSGAQVGFILLIALFVAVIVMLIFEFVKNKLIINAFFSSAIVFITEVYAILFYIFLTKLSGFYTFYLTAISHSYKKTYYEDFRGLKFNTQGLAIGNLFIILCIACFVIKCINYWLHHDNQTVAIKRVSFKKKVKVKNEET